MKEKLITIEIPSGYAVRNISEGKITLAYLYPRTFSECVEELGLQPTEEPSAEGYVDSEALELLQLINTENSVEVLPVADLDDWELVPNKFDIATLKPFESRVLARSDDKDRWKPAIFGGCARNRYNEIEYFYALGGTCWRNCIPYEGNEHLLGTTNDCDERFKTWEK